MIQIAALVSGRGSNLQAVIDACREGRIDGQVVLVISNKAEAPALQRAKDAGIDAVYGSSEVEMLAALESRSIDLVILAGYMRIVSPALIAKYPHRIMNIHPALLPAFPGLHAQQQALDYGVKLAGCTVHFVDEGVDTGPIIAQATVPVLNDDTPQTLAQRILEEEHRLYPQAIQWFAEGRVKGEGRRVKIC